MIYTAEPKSGISKTKCLLETTEMRILRSISGKTLLDKARSEEMRKSCEAEDINEYIREIECNEQ